MYNLSEINQEHKGIHVSIAYLDITKFSRNTDHSQLHVMCILYFYLQF